MKGARLSLVAAFVLALAVAAPAQEGHPLTGTWYGEFGTAGSPPRDLTLVMKWDGQKVTGLANPGPDAVPLQAATLDVTFAVNPPGRVLVSIGTDSKDTVPPKFTVRLEMDPPGKTGCAGRHVFEGAIQNPLASNRKIVGTWTCGNAKGEFSLQRL